MLRAENLTALAWLDHGFGTRQSEGWLDAAPAATLKQIHSNVVLPVAAPGKAGDGDALITRTPGLWLAVRSADCVPLILADPVTRSVAVVHAGWRGAAANIADATVQAMCIQFSTVAQDLHAAIGPGIGSCCFEVGPEVAEQFRPWSDPPSGRAHLDLQAILLAQLIESGLAPERIQRITRCTKCHPDEFHSYRRDGEAAGRMVSGARIAR